MAASLAASLQSTEDMINIKLLQLDVLINSLEDLSYSSTGTVDVDAMAAQVAVLTGNDATQDQDIIDLRADLDQEIIDRLSIMFSTTQAEFDTSKYKTVLDLSTNLDLLEGVVQGILQNGTGGDNNIQSDWLETNPQNDAYILNKPKWIQAVLSFYEWQSDTLINYAVYGDSISWKVERYQIDDSRWNQGSGNIPDTLSKCQMLTYI